MIEISDLELLKSSDIIVEEDNFHILRKNTFGNILSFRSLIDNLNVFYERKSSLDDYRQKVESILSNLETLVSSFITKKEVDEKYATKDNLKNWLTPILTRSKLQKKLQKFTNRNKVNEKIKHCKEEAHKAAAEMTEEVMYFIPIIDGGSAEGTTVASTMKMALVEAGVEIPNPDDLPTVNVHGRLVNHSGDTYYFYSAKYLAPAVWNKHDKKTYKYKAHTNSGYEYRTR